MGPGLDDLHCLCSTYSGRLSTQAAGLESPEEDGIRGHERTHQLESP